MTAPEYVAQFGFKRGKLADAPEALKASAELQVACPACAAFMSLTLRQVAPDVVDELPVAVLGAGPVGLAAAAKLLERGVPFVVLEAAEQVGANLLDYGHVRLFSPWQYNIDPAMAKLLEPSGWQAPPAQELPLAREVVDRVLQPFAELPRVARGLKLGTRGVSINRAGLDKVKSAGRDKAPFVIHAMKDGRPIELRARSSTRPGHGRRRTRWAPAACRRSAKPLLRRLSPTEFRNILGAQRDRFEGQRTLVVGAGHSAATALLALADLAGQSPGTRLVWSVRSPTLTRVFGGGDADALPARGRLGASLKQLRDTGALEFISGLRITEVRREAGSLTIVGLGMQGDAIELAGIVRVICATAQRPDLSLTRELRIKLDPSLESTEALGPLIDPNVHSCDTVLPHGHRELAHPESGFYTVGVKSYGRAPTFLMATGFEQVRWVVAAITGDREAADRVELDLPETGVCGLGTVVESDAESSCCGTEPVPSALAVSSRCCA